MQNQQGTNGGNGNGNGNGQLPDLTNREILKILLDEIADVRLELKRDIEALSGRMDKLEAEMQEMKKELNGKLDGLRMEVHQNQIMFMKGHDDLEQRVVAAEH